MFFGNHQKLIGIQRVVLETITPEKWDQIRKWVIEQNSNIKKMDRYGFTDEEVEHIKHARITLYTPPDYQTMKKVLASKSA